MNSPSRHSIEADFQPLTEADLRSLERCWITQELAEQAGLRRVDSATGSQIVSRNGNGNYSGILYPYHDDAGKSVLYVLRRDYPDIRSVDGKTKEEHKYLVAGGSRQRLYLPPAVDPSWLKDTSILIILAEGEKKALALWRLAWHGLGDAAEKPRFLPIGLRGVFGWSGRLGKETAPDGSPVDVKGPIPDLDRIAWRGRTVTICFDTNVTKPQVKAAREALTAEMERRGARVSWFEWPSDTPYHINGVDDYLALAGPEKVLKLIEAARPTSPTIKQQGDCPRDFQKLDEDRYKLSLHSLGITFDVDRLRRERSGDLVGELSVECDLPGSRTYNGTLSIADFNLSSARSRTERAKLLADRSRSKELDWVALLEEFSQLVIQATRQGNPAVTLCEVVKPTVNDLFRIEGVTLSRTDPAIIFGDGASAKSFTALFIAGRLAEQGMRVLIADWEMAAVTHRDRFERLFGANMSRNVLYARCEKPVVFEADRLRRIVRDQRVDYAIYDSIVFGCDGPPEAAECASRYFQSVRKIGVGSLHIAHITKAEGGDQKPFGSAFWFNGARVIWFAKLVESSQDGNVLSLGLFNRKSNLGRLCPPTGFKIVFSDDRTTFTRSNPADTPDLADHMSVRERMVHLLRKGALSQEAIAEEIGAKAETISRTVRRCKQVFNIIDGGKVALLERDNS